jgi:hypothetical protein
MAFICMCNVTEQTNDFHYLFLNFKDSDSCARIYLNKN